MYMVKFDYYLAVGYKMQVNIVMETFSSFSFVTIKMKIF